MCDKEPREIELFVVSYEEPRIEHGRVALKIFLSLEDARLYLNSLDARPHAITLHWTPGEPYGEIWQHGRDLLLHQATIYHIDNCIVKRKTTGRFDPNNQQTDPGSRPVWNLPSQG